MKRVRGERDEPGPLTLSERRHDAGLIEKLLARALQDGAEFLVWVRRCDARIGHAATDGADGQGARSAGRGSAGRGSAGDGAACFRRTVCIQHVHGNRALPTHRDANVCPNGDTFEDGAGCVVVRLADGAPGILTREQHAETRRADLCDGAVYDTGRRGALLGAVGRVAVGEIRRDRGRVIRGAVRGGSAVLQCHEGLKLLEKLEVGGSHLGSHDRYLLVC